MISTQVSWGIDGIRLKKWAGGDTPYRTARKWRDGDVIGCAADLGRGDLSFALNGVWSGPDGVAFRGVNCSGHDLVEYIADDTMTMSTKNTDRGIRSLPPATTRAERGEDPRCLAVLDRAFPVKNLSVACKTEFC